MAEEVLVGEQLTPDMIKSGELLVVALDKLDVVVKGACWLLLPDQRDWRLVIASTEVRVEGPRAMYRKIRGVLGRLPAGAAAVGTKDISAVDEQDPLFLLLRSAISTGPGVGGIRFSRNVVNGQLIEGCLPLPRDVRFNLTRRECLQDESTNLVLIDPDLQ